MQLKVFYVDAFSQLPFKGNPAAVCLLDRGIPEKLMQQIAAEINLSETAFILAEGDEKSWESSEKFQLRWFTPTQEVMLCGHATLAAAGIIFNKFDNKNHNIRFRTKSGEIMCRLRGESVSIDLPKNRPIEIYKTELADDENIKNLTDLFVPDRVREVLYSKERKKLLIVWKDDVSRKEFETFEPDTNEMLRVFPNKNELLYSVVLTMKGNGKFLDESGTKYDFVSRTFGPWVGIPEDPVTGSSHSILGPYWSETLSQHTFFVKQCSKRGGELLLTVHHEVVGICGNICVVMDGNLDLTDWEKDM